MASKYDSYWEAQSPRLRNLLRQAAERGTSDTLDVGDIRRLGNRQSWAGSATVRDGELLTSQMAHATALGRRLTELTREFPGVTFRATISPGCQLRIAAVAATNVHPPTPRAPGKSSRARPPIPSMPTPVPPGIADLSCQIHEAVWCLDRWRGPSIPPDCPADGIYFFFETGEEVPGGPRIVRVGINKTNGRLRVRLRQHFSGTRRSSVLRWHLGTALLGRQGAEEGLVHLWATKDRQELPEVEAEVSRLLEERFSIAVLPVADWGDRVRLERWLVAVLPIGPLGPPSPPWLGRWARSPNIVKSGLWNSEYVGDVEALKSPGMLELFLSLIAQALGTRESQPAPRGHRPPVLIILPCSGRKRRPAIPTYSEEGEARRLEQFVQSTRHRLMAGRQGLSAVIDPASARHAALAYYDGGLYRVSGLRQALAETVRSSEAEVVILSGAYGAVLADERIQAYDQVLDPQYWAANGLPQVLEEFIQRAGVERVVAFVARTTAYYQILSAVDWQGLRRRGLKEAGVISLKFRGHGGAQSVVPEGLGRAVLTFLRQGMRVERVLSNQWRGHQYAYSSFLKGGDKNYGRAGSASGRTARSEG